MQLDKGQRINAPFLPCAAEVLRFEPRIGYALLQVVLQDGQQTFRSLTVTDDQLATIEVLSQDGFDSLCRRHGSRLRVHSIVYPRNSISCSGHGR